MNEKPQKAYFAAGCFWGVQKEFDSLEGVVETTVGYMGGEKVEPTYEEVSSGKTGHAESIEVVYDPERISYRELLKKFFEIHDPTHVNRQGPDVGSQYRSAIFFRTDKQGREAKDYKKEISKSKVYDGPVVTEIKPADSFYPAEDYHQKYYISHPGVC